MSSPLISEVLGNRQRLDGGAMFGNAPRVVWSQWIEPDSLGRIPLQCRSMLVECDNHRILCETGIGAFFEPALRERYGVEESEHKLLVNLKSLGLCEDDIDYVILSHLHFDHAGGLLAPFDEANPTRKRLLFPKAKYVVGKIALARAESPHPRDRASFIPELGPMLRASSRLIVVDGDSHPDVLPERISFWFTHGHTPGHMHTTVHGDSSDITFAGDLVPGRAWVHLPITMGYDRYAEQVIDEKAALYKRLADSNQMGREHYLFYTHDHNCAMSTIAQDSKSKKYKSDVCNDHPTRFTI